MALTDTAIRLAKPDMKPFKMYDREGLFLLVNPSGSKLWRWRYRFDSKEKLIWRWPSIRSSGSHKTVVAEKLQALVQLRMLNTRMKDYFDLWLLTRQPELDKAALTTAFQRTFANRGMGVDPAPVGLSEVFGNDPIKQQQWTAFLKRSRLTQASESLAEVVHELRKFFVALSSGA